jgi:uncharacterized protein
MEFELVTEQLPKSLGQLRSILKKAQAFNEQKKIQPEVLLQSRLAPDQFPLFRQVQIACDTAKLGAARLTGLQAPVHDDSQTDWPDLFSRVDETISFLRSITRSQFGAFSAARVTLPWWNGKEVKGPDYLVQFMVPNFYFHMMTAYSILRKNGLDIGKNDYLGEMPFIRN